MSGRQSKIFKRRCAGLGLAAALVAGVAAAQSTAVSYPPSRALADITAWLQRDTPIGPSQVVDVNPSAVTAVTSAAPMGETRGFLANISSEALDPEIVSHDGIASWSIPVEVDCEHRMLRLGAMTGYRSRDLRSEPRIVRQPDTSWVTPTPAAPLGAVVRGLCDRDFHRPLVGRFKTAAKPPEPVKPPTAPTASTAEAAAPALRPALPPPPAPTSPSKPAAAGRFAVQIGASPSLPDVRALLARFKTKFSDDLAGLTTDVATVQLDGKSVNRALVLGFGSAGEADAFCKKLTAAGQACFVRR